MKLRREARTLKNKSMASLRRGLTSYNGYDENGRITSTLLHIQHACEMLIKASLVQCKVKLFDKQKGRSFGFDKCVNLASQHCNLTDGAAGVMRAISSLRDAEQHWIVVVDEEMLYLHLRGIVTSIDEVLKAVLADDLASNLPERALPVSTLPPRNIDLLVDREFRKISEILQPGRRARDEARGRIRALLALESHVVEEISVSERDIDRIERAIRGGKEIVEIFPRLSTIGTETHGEGLSVVVHFIKKQGAPVRFVSGDDPEEAGAIREIDLQKKFHITATDLAKKLGLTNPKTKALRNHLNLDSDKQCMHIFEFGKQKIPRFSDNALRMMKEFLKDNNIDEIWQAQKG